MVLTTPLSGTVLSIG